MTDNVVELKNAIKGAEKTRRGRAKPPKGGGGETPPPDPPRGAPPRLPHDSPVQAIGRLGRVFYFLDADGQFAALLDKDLGRNAIIALFGGDEYLRKTWPKYDRSGKFIINFDHGALSPVLISSCRDKGLWNPEEGVRGPGAWIEGNDELVMHCGDALYVSSMGQMKLATGMRDRLLYPASPATYHPLAGQRALGGPAWTLLEKLKTWNWQRGDTDALLLLGWIAAAMLGAAPDWRPMAWITGGPGTGKSTLMKLIRWLFGERGIIQSADATAAGVKQRVNNSALPVSIDEVENEPGNDRVQQLVKLARIAASGDEALRGSPGGTSVSFTARNSFLFSSIIVPGLRQQDKSRMAILSLDAIEWDGAKQKRGEPGEDPDELETEDDVLGPRAEWMRISQQMRGCLLASWPRYKATWRAYRRALEAAGHSARGADQFGALGAAADCVMYGELDDANVNAWAQRLPAANLAETTGYVSNQEACKKHLLSAMLEYHRGGSRESVSRLLRDSRRNKMNGQANEDAADQVLQQHGIRLFRHTGSEHEGIRAAWVVAVSRTHSAIARIFRDTDWHGVPGAPGPWSQALDRLPGVLPGANGQQPRLRIDGDRHYVTLVPWETLFPPIDEKRGDVDEHELVHLRDRYDGNE